MTTTFADLRKAADGLDVMRGLGSDVDNILDRARINADDAVYVEKAASTEEWDGVALSTVKDILSYTSDKPVVDWFYDNGL